MSKLTGTGLGVRHVRGGAAKRAFIVLCLLAVSFAQAGALGSWLPEWAPGRDGQATTSTERSNRSVRRQIERQYQNWATAALTNDVDGVLSILAPSYTLTTFDGKVIPLEKYEVSLRKRKASGQKPDGYKTSIESLDVKGDGAVVISLETSIKDTPDPITNKIQKLVHVHQYRDTWSHESGSWKLVSTVTLVEKTSVAKS